SLSLSCHLSATTELHPLSLHDALPILATTRLPAGAAIMPPRTLSTPDARPAWTAPACLATPTAPVTCRCWARPSATTSARRRPRSEEHTSELQSLTNLVCRLLLEKKKC